MAENFIIDPLAELLPPMTEQNMETLCAAIEKFGADIFGPVVTRRVPEPDGTMNGTKLILANRDVHLACTKMGVRYKEVVRDDSHSETELWAAASFLLNRHLLDGQWTVVAVEIAERESTRVCLPKRQQTAFAANAAVLANWPKPCSDNGGAAEDGKALLHGRAIASKYTGVSERTIGRGIQLKRESPEYYQKLRTGEIPNVFSALNRLKSARKRPAQNPVSPKIAVKRRNLKDVFELFVGDNARVLNASSFPAVDLAFFDPPYNNGTHYDSDPSGDRMPEADYVEGVRRVIALTNRKLSPKGTICVLTTDRYLGRIDSAMRDLGLHFFRIITWWNHFPQNQTTRYPEDGKYVLIFTKHPRSYVFHPPQVVTVRNASNDPRSVHEGKVPGNVVPIPAVVGNSNERAPSEDMPPQLPLELPLRLILGHSEPGNVVLDAYHGNGTTSIAAMLSGRPAIGIERSKKYAEQSRSLIDAAMEKGVAGLSERLQKILRGEPV